MRVRAKRWVGRRRRMWDMISRSTTMRTMTPGVERAIEIKRREKMGQAEERKNKKAHELKKQEQICVS